MLVGSIRLARLGTIWAMSDAEIERIFRSLDRIEARLSKLEEREAIRRGSDMTKGQLVAVIGVISAATGAVTAIISQVI